MGAWERGCAVMVVADVYELVLSSMAGCARVQAHLYARASLQSGGAMYVGGASSISVSGGSTIEHSTAQRVCRSVAVRVLCANVCVLVHW